MVSDFREIQLCCRFWSLLRWILSNLSTGSKTSKLLKLIKFRGWEKHFSQLKSPLGGYTLRDPEVFSFVVIRNVIIILLFYNITTLCPNLSSRKINKFHQNHLNLPLIIVSRPLLPVKTSFSRAF